MTAALEVPLLAEVLTRAGHAVRACRACGRAFAADVDHAGHPHKWRRYCSRECRAWAAGRRAVLPRASLAAHRREHGDLIARHALEAAGQLDLTGEPLPPLPDPPSTPRTPRAPRVPRRSPRA